MYFSKGNIKETYSEILEIKGWSAYRQNIRRKLRIPTEYHDIFIRVTIIFFLLFAI